MKREKEERVRHIIKWQLVDLIFCEFFKDGCEKEVLYPKIDAFFV